MPGGSGHTAASASCSSLSLHGDHQATAAAVVPVLAQPHALPRPQVEPARETNKQTNTRWPASSLLPAAARTPLRALQHCYPASLNLLQPPLLSRTLLRCESCTAFCPPNTCAHRPLVIGTVMLLPNMLLLQCAGMSSGPVAKWCQQWRQVEWRLMIEACHQQASGTCGSRNAAVGTV